MKTEELQLTDWYPADVKPVRKGVYETIFTDWKGIVSNAGYSLWDGNLWSFTEASPQANFSEGAVLSKEWRGVRRWVLVTNRPICKYLFSARPGIATFWSLEKARPFKTQRAAERFAARYKHLDLVAVLP